MGMTVAVDALVYWNGSALANRNETTVSQEVDIAEARPFVSSIANAYATKLPTWKSWKVSLNGYYDDTDDTLQNAIKDGTVGQIVIYPTRDTLTAYWYGNAFASSVENSITSEDYVELNAEFEGSGVLTWIS